MKVLHEEYGERLCRRDDGSLALTVLVGTIGEYEITIVLNSEEEEGYSAGGEYFAHTLALKVAKDPHRYIPRAVSEE